VRDAIEGQAVTDAKGSKPQGLDDVAMQYVLGLRKSVAYDDSTPAPPEVKAVWAQRRRVASAYRNEASRRTKAQPASENPFMLSTKNLSPKAAREQVPLTARYIDTLLTSGRVVDARGQMTEEGKGRITNGVRYLEALCARAK
jgi:hypothetical protein